MRKTLALIAVTLAACSGPTEEDRAPLLGRWEAVVISGQFLELQPDGTFVYRYGPDASSIYRRLVWRLDRLGELTISMVGGGNAVRCAYELSTSGALTLDNGRGGPCLSDVPNMARFFRHNPTAELTILPPGPPPIP